MIRKIFNGVVQQSLGTCRCPQCVSGHSGSIARQAGSAAARNGQRSRYMTTSTILYSSIFASAATLDSIRKDKRREQWDKAIADLKDEIANGADEQEAALEEEQVITGRKSAEEAFTQKSSGSWEDEIFHFGLDSSPLALGTENERWHANTGLPLNPYNLAPESVYKDETWRETHGSRHWTPKKIEIINIVTDLLQVNMLAYSQEMGWRKEAAQSVPSPFKKIVKLPQHHWTYARRKLVAELYRVWKARSDLKGHERGERVVKLGEYTLDRSDTLNDVRKLNTTLRELFAGHPGNSKNHGALLANVCYALSASPTPPNLNTYNILIAGLSDVGLEGLASHAIDSVRRCQLRPNETTLSLIFRHFTKYNDAKNFSLWFELLQGKDDGLALARPDILVNEASQGRLVRKKGDDEKILQLPYPTTKVFAAVVAGILRFSGFDAALEICRSMGENGWGLCMDSLGPLLNDCAHRQDIDSGLGVWGLVEKLEAKAKYVRARRTEHTEKIPTHVFAAMLRLCRGVGDQRRFDQIWEHASNVWRHDSVQFTKLMDGTSMKTEPEAIPAMVEQSSSDLLSNQTPDIASLDEIQPLVLLQQPLVPDASYSDSAVHLQARTGTVIMLQHHQLQAQQQRNVDHDTLQVSEDAAPSSNGSSVHQDAMSHTIETDLVTSSHRETKRSQPEVKRYLLRPPHRLSRDLIPAESQYQAAYALV